MNKYRIIITGIVQGVGFRPFIYNLCVQNNLNGWVGNSDSNVIIEVEANKNQLFSLISQIKETAPTLSKIESINYKELPFEGFKDFTIRNSKSSSKGNIFISPDVATCDDCVRELKDKENRRYLYPFINCTNCGPRFTIIKDIPYDRDKTTMNSFEMCDSCRQEYTTPSDRRYHAQPVACHKCGPSLKIVEGKSNSNTDLPTNIVDNNNNNIENCGLKTELKQKYGDSHSFINTKKCIDYITQIIKNGQIAAIKGIGGYHFACDALNDDAVERLRTRKHRDKKPFALMMKNIDIISKYCEINEKEIQLLKSPASPIVLLKKKAGIKLPAMIAPFNRYLGVMLPYTPIHHILFEQDEFPQILVMTSGNLSSEPIFYKEDAICELSDIADAFLTNNRDIYIRTDDSVTRVFDNKEYIIRRSRGYVPEPIILDVCKLLNIHKDSEIPSILACGGELKNVFCLNKNNLFYLSHHIGDLENESTNNSFTSGIEHFKKLFDISPKYIAYDLHPNYFSSQYALKQPIKNKIAIQHHKAHIASCMAENELCGDVIGVSFDGTGYGEDGTIWGGEFFKGGYNGFERVGHLDYVMMPGGDSAVKHPWRMAVGYLFKADKTYLIQNNNEQHDYTDAKNDVYLCSKQQQLTNNKNRILLGNINQNEIDFTIKMLEKQLNCPKSSSMGRLFDAVSALLGISTDISYEGQAAIELEYYAVEQNIEPYDISLYCETTKNVAGSNDVSSFHNSDFTNNISYSDNTAGSSGVSNSSNSDCTSNINYSNNSVGSDSVNYSNNAKASNISNYAGSDSQRIAKNDKNKAGFVVKTSSIINQIIQDIQNGQSKEHIASKFHSTIAEIVLQGCNIIRENSKLSTVVLSGGVFQNITLLKLTVDRLRNNDFIVYTHSQYPANDGGIALGQAMMALAGIFKNKT